jgi:hypothetical protein
VVGKPEGKRAFGKPGRRCEGNLRMDFVEIEWNGIVDWIDVAEDMDRWRAVVIAEMNLCVV